MTDRIMLTLTLHTPFRVATGSAGDGADDVVHRGVPVPATSIKGVMRAAAGEALEDHHHPAVIEVFGGELSAAMVHSPWHWEDPTFDFDTLNVAERSRIQIDQKTHTTIHGALLVAEEFAPATATVEIWRSGPVDANRIRRHRALLTLAACLVDGIGSDRRAGNGWASLHPTPPLDETAIDEMVQVVMDWKVNR